MENIFSYDNVQGELIRSLIAQPNMIPSVSKQITADDFSIEKFKVVYRDIIECQLQGISITRAGLSNRVFKISGITLGDEDFYKFFNDDEPVEPPIDLAEILKRESIKNKLLDSTKAFTESVEDPQEGLLEEIGHLQRELENYSLELTQREEITFNDQLKLFDESIRETKSEGIPSFYPSLDKFTGGWQPEQLITVAARTSVGKSIVAVNNALASALNNKSVLFFSLEMGSSELISRLVASKSFIKLHKLYPNYKITDAEEEKLYKDTLKSLYDLPITIDDTPDVSLDYIKSRSIELSKSEKGLDFIIIDYIQLISTKGLAGKSRQENVAEISRGLKVLAKQLKVPVMVVAQLNRESKDDEDRLPSKADIRESAAIAADSDVVLIIHRKYRDTSEDPKATFILDKNRNGIADKRIQMRCMLDRALFQDLEYDEDEEENKNDNESTNNTQTKLVNDDFNILSSNENIENDLFDVADANDLFGDITPTNTSDENDISNLEEEFDDFLSDFEL